MHVIAVFIDNDIEDQSTVSHVRVAYLPISHALLGLYGSKCPKEKGDGTPQNESSPDL